MHVVPDVDRSFVSTYATENDVICSSKCWYFIENSIKGIKLKSRRSEDLCSAVCILIRLQAEPLEPQGSIPAGGRKHFTSSLYQDWLWDTVGLFFYNYWGSSKVMALTTLFHIMPIVRIDWNCTSKRWTGLMVGYCIPSLVTGG
jgi:hypothetical protein